MRPILNRFIGNLSEASTKRVIYQGLITLTLLPDDCKIINIQNANRFLECFVRIQDHPIKLKCIRNAWSLLKKWSSYMGINPVLHESPRVHYYTTESVRWNQSIFLILAVSWNQEKHFIFLEISKNEWTCMYWCSHKKWDSVLTASNAGVSSTALIVPNDMLRLLKSKLNTPMFYVRSIQEVFKSIIMCS